MQGRLNSATNQAFEPVKLKGNLSLGEVAKVVARKIEFPGLQVDVSVGREYTHSQIAGHVVGYLSQMTMRQIKEPDYYGLPTNSYVGQYGIEKFYNSSLMGKVGKEIIEVDALGRETRVVGVEHPLKGNDINLTIDIPVQLEAVRNLKEKTGAIVAVVPDTGEILALASSPSFDPNLFSGGISKVDWNDLITDPKKPLLNRGIQSRYPPGSIFKVITALAALEENIITPKTSFNCKGFIELGGREFRCWNEKGHGRVNLHSALAESCDVFFYEVAKKIDVDILAEYAEMFGLGTPSGIDLEGELSGFIPTSGWKKHNKKERWYLGETLNTAIGQGYLTTTPVQMAVMTAAVVNGGRLIRPSILLDDSVRMESEDENISVSPESLEIVKKALISSVKGINGTGKRAHSKITEIGGKTGTAQVVSRETISEDLPAKFMDHAWFIAFAPQDKPQIAVAVFVEHGGSGGSTAAPIAKNVIEAYFKNRSHNDNVE
jgi:penicillin-binding protein 2